ncbi:hypothetical protein BH10ACT1_BH10ACT1_31710 [soil metagenome]
MELTLKRLLEQAEFTETRKGYDRGQVDDFLDKAVAMATKVEARLTQALDQAKTASVGAGPSAAEIDAEVDRRVQARLAELPSPAAPVAFDAPSAPSEDETAEEVRRTLVLAQRTADAAVREAREDAAKLLADAQERAAALNADAEAAAANARAGLSSEIESERRAAHDRLAAEIGELEGAREALRTDVTVLERHVEEQRSQLGSTIGELQRLLDDPAGFRLAPSPVLLEPEVPSFEAPAHEPSAPEAAAPEPEPEPEPASHEPPAAPLQAAVVIDAEPADLSFDEVDHAAPGLAGLPDSGPPTAPVSAVDLGMTAPGAPVRSGTPPGAEAGEDPFLAELRKAMADEEPLGPRDQPSTSDAEPFGDGEEDQRGWRFGKRR